MPSYQSQQINLEGNKYTRRDLRLGNERDVATFLGANVPTRITWHKAHGDAPGIDRIKGVHVGHRNSAIRYQQLNPEEIDEQRKQQARRIAAGFSLGGGTVGVKLSNRYANKLEPKIQRGIDAVGSRLAPPPKDNALARLYRKAPLNAKGIASFGAKTGGVAAGALVGAGAGVAQYRRSRSMHDSPRYKAAYRYSPDTKPPRIVLPS